MGSKAILSHLLTQDLAAPDKVVKVLLAAAISSLRAEHDKKSGLFAGLLERHLRTINGTAAEPTDVRGLPSDIRQRMAWPLS